MSAAETGGAEWAFLQEHFSGQLYEDLKRRAYSLAGRRQGQIDPSGLAVEALLLAARAEGQLRDPAKFKSWVTTILVREVTHELMRPRCRRRQELGDEGLQEIRDEREGARPPDQLGSASEAGQVLSGLLSRLPATDRAIVCLTRIKGFPDEDVANLLGLSVDALRQRRSRALRRLRDTARNNP